MTVSQIHHLLQQQAHQRPRAPALWWRGRAINYADLEQRAMQLAARLSSEGEVGDRIAVLSWNCPQFIELIYAASLSGRVLVPLNARLAPAEWIYQLQHAQVNLLFAETELLQQLRGHKDCPSALPCLNLDDEYSNWAKEETNSALPPTSTADIAWILYTSGSTGRPKGAMLSHAGFLAGLRSAALARPVEPGDTYLYPFPLFHVAAHNVLLQHQYGAAVALMKSFDAGETLQLCRQLQVTSMSLAPTMIALLLDHPDFRSRDLDSVRTIGYGASAMPQSLLQRLLETSNVGLCQSYGMTELCGSVAFLTVEDHQRAAAGETGLLQSVGQPLPTTEIRLQEGEILVRAEQCMLGYWRDEKATAAALQDGWLHTGDMGRFDETGNLYIVDRKKDMIISGGENIASREIEEALRAHPAVKECAVIGLPDPKWGETPCAVVQLQAEIGDEELQAHCRERLAGYKTPRHWRRLEQLPVNAGGKIDKPALRQMFIE